jgi:hypothetical protein
MGAKKSKTRYVYSSGPGLRHLAPGLANGFGATFQGHSGYERMGNGR